MPGEKWKSSFLVTVQNNLVSSANTKQFESNPSGKSFMYKMKSKGPRTLPCVTPLTILQRSESTPQTLTCWDLFSRKELIHCTVNSVMWNHLSWASKWTWETVFKALAKWKVNAINYITMSWILVHFSDTSKSCKVVERPGIKPNCL